MPPGPAELEHGYGDRVHILASPLLTSLLARLGHPETAMPVARRLLRRVYTHLLGAIVEREFPTTRTRVPTRMVETTDKGYWEGPVLAPDTRVVLACLVRAGVLASETCLEILCDLLPPSNLRLDYLEMQRVVDPSGRVLGARDCGVKIGGSIEGAILLVPDPMGATGGTVLRTLEIYESLRLGKPCKTIAAPMIMTPEFVRALAERRPEVILYAARLDRGLSDPEALRHPPGVHPGERGLDDHQYIVPGAGGIGEVLTNCWV